MQYVKIEASTNFDPIYSCCRVYVTCRLVNDESRQFENDTDSVVHFTIEKNFIEQ